MTCAYKDTRYVAAAMALRWERSHYFESARRFEQVAAEWWRRYMVALVRVRNEEDRIVTAQREAERAERAIAAA